MPPTHEPMPPLAALRWRRATARQLAMPPATAARGGGPAAVSAQRTAKKLRNPRPRRPPPSRTTKTSSQRPSRGTAVGSRRHRHRRRRRRHNNHPRRRHLLLRFLLYKKRRAIFSLVDLYLVFRRSGTRDPPHLDTAAPVARSNMQTRPPVNSHTLPTSGASPVWTLRCCPRPCELN